MKAFLSVLVLLTLLAACGPAAARPLPRLDGVVAERLALKADDAWRKALSTADPRPLAGIFAARALEAARERLEQMRRQGVRLEERLLTRRLVHWSGEPGHALTVLEVSVERRLIAARRAVPPWSRVLRQWSLTLEWLAGAWRVVGASELRPESWWR